MKKTVMIIMIMTLCLVFVSCNHSDPLESIATTPEKTADEFSVVEGFTLSREFFDKDFSGTVISKSRDTIGYGDYIYLRHGGFIRSNENDISMMVKYSIDTGEKTSVCPDPLCIHYLDSDCFFSREFYIHDIKDDIIYYTGNYKSSEMIGINGFDRNGNYVGINLPKEDYYASYIKPFYAFNMKTGERELLFEFHSEYGYDTSMTSDPIFAMTDEKIIFKERSFEYETVGDNEVLYRVTTLCSFDRKTKKIEKLIEYSRWTADENGHVHSTGLDYSPYFYDEKSNKVFYLKSYNNVDDYTVYATYAAPLDDKNPEFEEIYPNGTVICITEDGRYIATKLVKRDENISNYDMILYDPETKEETVLLDNFKNSLTWNYALCGDWVMTVPQEYTYHTYREGEKTVNITISQFGDDLVLVNYKTLEKMTIPIANAFKDNSYNFVGPGISYNYYKGRTIYEYYMYARNEYDKIIRSGYSYIMLDLATGKFKVFRDEKIHIA